MAEERILKFVIMLEFNLENIETTLSSFWNCQSDMDTIIGELNRKKSNIGHCLIKD